MNNNTNSNLIRFNEGGLHSENKFGGIPVGGNNTVEQGETKLKNYVYSNRLSIDENMTKEMNLPSYIKGKTFASASKAIDNKFKDRNDNHSLETKKIFLDRLKQAQETLKQQEQQRAEQIAQSMQSNQQEVPDMMNGQIPEGMEEYTEQPEQFFAGGDIVKSEIGNQTGGMSGLSGKMSPYLGAAEGALSLASLAQGNGASTDKFSSALGGAFTGVKAGMAFGPLGAGIGGAVGIGAGLLGANKANKEKQKNILDYSKSINNQFSENQFGDGGELYPNFTKLNPFEGLKGNSKFDYPYTKFPKPDAPLIENPNLQGLNPGIEINDLSEKNGYSNPELAPNPNTTNQGVNPNKFSIGDGLNKNGGKFLRYAPVAMNAYQLAKLKKPTNLSLQRLDSRYNPEYVDESQLQNIANQEMTNTINGISQSGASQGAIRSSMLGAGLNKTKALSDAYMKANAENRATDDKAQQFNLGVNQFNTQTQHQEQENWEKNDANYRNEKSKYLSAIGSDLGEIGKEEVNKNQIAEALGYSWDGKYMVDKKTGEKKTYEDVVNKKESKEYKFKNKFSEFGKISYNPTKYKF